MRAYSVTKPFEGVLHNLQRRWQETDSAWVREEMSRYQAEKPCAVCNGARLKPEALAVRVGGEHIAAASDLSIRRALAWFAGVEATLTPQRAAIAGRILKEIGDRLRFLDDVGLEYLTLSRGSTTLSGGESQRIRLASQIGSGLTGVLYVLDEPSIGLHQRDNERLLGTLRRLKALGNTVLVVEHDEDAIRAADHLIDMGPAAGTLGGHVIAQGTPAEVAANPASLTGDYLSGRRAHRGAGQRRGGEPGAHDPRGGRARQQPAGRHGRVPARHLLLHHRRVRRRQVHAGDRHAVEGGEPAADGQRPGAGAARPDRGLDQLDKIIDIDQSPIGRTPRSNPATYTDLFAPIRDWFAELPEAGRAATNPAGSASTSRAGGARRARATAC